MFNGRRDPELYKEYGRWLPYIVGLFLPGCDGENGNLIHLPAKGGTADQPYMTMQILLVIQGCYREHLHSKIQKMQSKKPASSGMRRRRSRR